MSERPADEPKDKPAADDGELIDSLKELLQGEDLGEGGEAGAEEPLATADEPQAGAAAPPKHSAPAKKRIEARGPRERRARDLQEYRDLDALTAVDAVGLTVSPDRLTVTLKRVGPDDTYTAIVALLQSHRITHGIDHEAIRVALARSRGGAPVYGVLVAQGTAPAVRHPGGTHYHLPAPLVSHKTENGYAPTPFDELRKLLNAPTLGSLESWPKPVRIVRPGDVVTEVRAAEVEPGRDVHGAEIVPEAAPLPELKAGENTALSEDGRQCVATLYGYAGLVEGVPTVLPPVWLPPSLLEARFVYLPPVHSVPPTPADVEAVLKAKYVAFGVLPKRISQVCRLAVKAKSEAVVVTVAEGQPAQPGENAKLTYKVPLEQMPAWSQMQKIRKCRDLPALEELLGEIRQPEGAALRAVHQGEVLLEKTPPSQGLMGKDIQGEEVVPDEGKDVEIKPGENVSLGEGGRRCTADLYGYVCRHSEQLCVVSPLWMGESKQAVYLLNLPGLEAADLPSVEEMQALLGRVGKGGVQGFSAEHWAEVLQGMHPVRKDQLLVPVCQGTPMQPGRDAEFQWSVDVEEKPGTIKEDGSIDFRDRHLTAVVTKDQLIGRLVPAQPGVPGRDVLGGEIPAPAPLQIEVSTTAQVRSEASDGGTAYYAAVEGGVMTTTEERTDSSGRRRTIKIDVYKVFNIESDVDYTTGNIAFNGDVRIKGAIKSGFTVEATGSVQVGELIEAGAQVTAGRDILVQAGIVGRDTRLVAGGSVVAKFVQEANIRADGDVKVGTYFLEATVRARGKVEALGKGEGKGRAAVGGLVWGARGVEAKSLGSPSNTNLRVVAGVDPEEVANAEKIRGRMRALEEQQRKVLFGEFGLKHLDADLIKQKLHACTQPEERRKLLRGVKALSELTEKRQALQRELEGIVEEQRKLAQQASVVVTNELFAGVEVRLGEHSLKVQEDTQRVGFRLVEEEGRVLIQMAPL